MTITIKHRRVRQRHEGRGKGRIGEEERKEDEIERRKKKRTSQIDLKQIKIFYSRTEITKKKKIIREPK